MFEHLMIEDIHRIIDLELNNLYKRIKEIGYTIEITMAAKDYLVEKGWDAQFGARPLKRAIQKYLEDSLAEELIKVKIKDDSKINIDYIKEEDRISIEIIPPVDNIEGVDPKEEESKGKK